MYFIVSLRKTSKMNITAVVTYVDDDVISPSSSLEVWFLSKSDFEVRFWSRSGSLSFSIQTIDYSSCDEFLEKHDVD